MEDYNDIFSLSAEDFKEEDKKPVERYRVDAKQGTDNVYTSVVRFLPWWKNSKESIKNKWTCWLEDPDTDDGMYVDCPSSIGKKSILQDIFWKLKKSDSIADQELSKKFSRRQQFASLVQVIKDDHHPELNGKVLVYQYGVKVHKQIMGEMKPKYGTPHVPFDVFEGRPFLFQVTLVSGFNNYDECKFVDAEEPVKIGDDLITEKSPENLKKLVEWLKETSPDLDSYGYREWTNDTNDFVMKVVRNTVPKGKIIESIEKLNTSLTGKDAPVSAPKPTPASAPKPSETKLEEEKLPNIPETDEFADLDLDNIEDDLYDKL
jgi:hypothetical protein